MAADIDSCADVHSSAVVEGMKELIITLAILVAGYGAFGLYIRRECKKAKKERNGDEQVK